MGTRQVRWPKGMVPGAPWVLMPPDAPGGERQALPYPMGTHCLGGGCPILQAGVQLSKHAVTLGAGSCWLRPGDVKRRRGE